MGHWAMKTQVISLWAAFAFASLPLAAAIPIADNDVKQASQAAKQAYVSHDYATAADQYQRALKSAKPDAFKLRILLLADLGAAYREAHQYLQSQEAFKQAITIAEKNHMERDPAGIAAMHQYAALLRRMKQYIDADLMEARASSSSAAVPLQPPVVMQAPAVTQEPAPKPDTAEKAHEKGVRTLEDISVDEIKELLVKYPQNVQLWAGLASKYESMSKWADAVSTFQSIKQKFPKESHAYHLELAYCLDKNKQTKDGIDELKLAIDANPQDSKPYMMLHHLYIETGDLKAAIENDETFLDKFPNDQNYAQMASLAKILKEQKPDEGDKPTRVERRENWLPSYMPLKVYAPSSDEQFKFPPSTTGIPLQTPDQMVAGACDSWSRASQNRVRFIMVNRPVDSNIEIRFTDNSNGMEDGKAGFTQWQWGEAKVRIVISKVDRTGKPVTPEMFVNTVLHELGHGLGLAHSRHVEDVMYPSLTAQPVTELSPNDAHRVIVLYTY